MRRRRLGTAADIAKELNATVNQVRYWYLQRARNGFPEAVVLKTARNGMPKARHHDLDACLAWHQEYRAARRADTMRTPG